MAARGTKPKPLALRLVTGNAGKRPLPKPDVAPAGKPKCPAQLTKDQRAVWRQFIGPCHWLTPADAPLAAVFACLYAEFLADPAGMQAARISNLRAAMASLGLDASQRARMDLAPPAPSDTVDAYFFS